MVYYSLTSFFYLLGGMEIYLSKRKDRTILVIIALISLIIFVGFKKIGGTDFLSYRSLFNGTGGFSSEDIEPLFVSLILLVHLLGKGFYFFYFMIATINLSIKITIFKKMLPFVFPALLVYLSGLFFERDNDGIRQGLSIAFCYLSIPYLLNNKKMLFFMLTAIASLIHYSSIIFFFSIFLNKIRISDRMLLAIVLIAFIFPFTGLSLTNYLIAFLPESSTATKIDIYANSDFSSLIGINIGLVFRLLLLCLFLYYHQSLKIKSELYYFLRNGFSFAIILSLLFYDFGIIAHRLPYAYREFQIMIVPFFLTITSNKNNQFILLTIFYLYSMIIQNRFLTGLEANSYLSYDNWLF
jgi:hypothetical protein